MNYASVNRTVSHELTLASGEKKQIKTAFKSQKDFRGFLDKCAEMEKVNEGLPPREAIKNTIILQAEELGLMFGEDSTLFLDNFDSEMMVKIMQDTVGEYMAGKKDTTK